MDKYQLSERDICTKFITPAIQQAGWQQHQFSQEVNLTDGRRNILVDQTMQQDFAPFGEVADLRKMVNKVSSRPHNCFVRLDCIGQLY